MSKTNSDPHFSALDHPSFEAAAAAITAAEVAALAKIGSWTFCFANQTLTWSQEIKAVLEIDGRFEPSFAAALQFYHPDAQETFSSHVEATQASGEEWDLELPMITANGRNIWVRTTSRCIRHDDQILGLAGVFQDVTLDVQRRLELQDMASQAHQALANLSTYKEILDHHALVATIALDGRFVFVNDLFCATSGYRREELIGQHQSILETDFHPPSFFQRMRLTLMRGKTWHSEVSHSAKNRENLWVDMTIVPVLGQDGRPDHFVSVSYDITERKRTEAKLGEAISRAAGFFDVAHDAICVADRTGKYVSVNPAFEKVLGYPAREIEGKGFTDLIHPEDVEPTIKAVIALSKGQPVNELINRYRRQDGQWRWMEWRGTPRDGFVYSSARDITERLMHERELMEARERAEQATRAKSQFLANMSHEIRTPLNGVVGIAGALARLDMPSKQREMVELIKSSGETLERLLNDILDLSKIEEEKFDFIIDDFDLVKEIEVASHLMGVRANEKGIEFKLEFGDGARGIFKSDAVRLRQIVGNLASNAVKFTQTGGVKILVDIDDKDDLQAELVIKVIDTGIGFDDDVAKRLFTRFEQADGTITRSYGGSGLGLSICRAICEMSGGSISATSKPGQGSCFTAVIPMKRALSLAEFDTELLSADESVQTNQHELDDRSIHVLVAEDHQINQKVIAMILEPFGVDITFANNGLEAISLFDSGAFDMILMDMQMPEMDGLTAIKMIRDREQNRSLKRTPIAVLSANAMSEHVAASIEAGGDLHIAKPVTPDSLTAGIEKLLLLGDGFGVDQNVERQNCMA